MVMICIDIYNTIHLATFHLTKSTTKVCQWTAILHYIHSTVYYQLMQHGVVQCHPSSWLNNQQ